MEVKEGMIGLSGGDLWIQKAIRFFIESDFSHSFMVRKRDDGMFKQLGIRSGIRNVEE